MSDIYVEHNRLGDELVKGQAYTLLFLPLFLSLFTSYLAIDTYLSCAKETYNPSILGFSVNGFIFFILNICLTLILLIVSILTYTDYWSKIRVSKDGVLVKYPYFFISEKLIPWEAFQTVSICTHCYRTRVYIYPTVYVCMVKHGEEKDIRGNWKTEDPFHFTRVIRLRYTPELVCFLQEKCGITVTDQRNVKGMPVQ